MVAEPSGGARVGFELRGEEVELDGTARYPPRHARRATSNPPTSNPTANGDTVLTTFCTEPAANSARPDDG